MCNSKIQKNELICLKLQDKNRVSNKKNNFWLVKTEFLSIFTNEKGLI